MVVRNTSIDERTNHFAPRPKWQQTATRRDHARVAGRGGYPWSDLSRRGALVKSIGWPTTHKVGPGSCGGKIPFPSDSFAL